MGPVELGVVTAGTGVAGIWGIGEILNWLTAMFTEFAHLVQGWS